MESEGPQEILQLIIQEQADDILKEEVIDFDDYADWIQWVSDAEQSRHAIYESTQDSLVPLLLQPSPAHNPSILVLL